MIFDMLQKASVLIRKVVLIVSALAALLVLAGVMPDVASAKSCSAYSNQAAAQRAADTRDSDRDGIYCESLPCPCLKKGAKKPDKKVSAEIRGRLQAVIHYKKD